MEPTHTNALLNEEYLSKVNEVVNFLSRKQDFGLLFCTSDNFRLRKEVNKQVIAKLALKGIAIKDIFVEDTEHFTPFSDQFKAHLQENKNLKGLILNNLDYLIDTYPDALYTFNQSRDILTKLKIVLVIWIKQEDIARFATSAQDIFSFRTISTIEFPDIPFHQSNERLESRFSENYQTNEEYEKIKLNIGLYERQLKEAEESGYPINRTIQELVIPLYASYIDYHIFDKAKELYLKYETKLQENNLGHLRLKFDYLEENRFFQEAIEIGEKIASIEIKKEDHKQLAGTYDNIASVYKKLGQFQKALDFNLKTIEILQENFDNKDSSLVTSYNNIASTYENLGQFQKALEFYLKAIEIKEEISDYKDPTLATYYNNIAGTYYYLGQFQKALKFYLKAIKIQQEILDDKHPNIATSYNNIALTYNNLEKFEKALESQLKAIKIRQKILNDKHPDIATSYNNIALTYNDLGQFQKALEFQLKAINILQEIFDKNHPNLANFYNNIAATYFSLGQMKNAFDYSKKAMAIMEHPQNKDLPTYQDIKKFFAFYKSKMPKFVGKKPGRNEPCHCGSGKKYKKCHLKEDSTH